MTIELVQEARVEQRDDAAVRFGAHEAADALLECQRRFGQHELVERLAAAGANQAITAGHHRVGRHRKGQAVNHHQAQRLAGDVHALPKRARGKEHGIARGLKLAHEVCARGIPLLEQGIPDVRTDCVIQVAHAGQRGAQDECAPAAVGDQPVDFARQFELIRLLIAVAIRRRQMGRGVDQHAVNVVKGAGHVQRHTALWRAHLAAKVIIAVGRAQRGRRTDDRLDLVEEVFGQEIADFQWPLDYEDGARVAVIHAFDEAHPTRRHFGRHHLQFKLRQRQVLHEAPELRVHLLAAVGRFDRLQRLGRFL